MSTTRELSLGISATTSMYTPKRLINWRLLKSGRIWMLCKST